MYLSIGHSDFVFVHIYMKFETKNIPWKGIKKNIDFTNNVVFKLDTLLLHVIVFSNINLTILCGRDLPRWADEAIPSN